MTLRDETIDSAGVTAIERITWQDTAHDWVRQL
jgi:hypothetical protein